MRFFNFLKAAVRVITIVLQVVIALQAAMEAAQGAQG